MAQLCVVPAKPEHLPVWVQFAATTDHDRVRRGALACPEDVRGYSYRARVPSVAAWSYVRHTVHFLVLRWWRYWHRRHDSSIRLHSRRYVHTQPHGRSLCPPLGLPACQVCASRKAEWRHGLVLSCLLLRRVTSLATGKTTWASGTETGRTAPRSVPPHTAFSMTVRKRDGPLVCGCGRDFARCGSSMAWASSSMAGVGRT